MSAASHSPRVVEPIFGARRLIDHNMPTAAEREALKAFARHGDPGRVAMVLGVSRKTVLNRLNLAREKLGARDNAEAIAKLREREATP